MTWPTDRIILGAPAFGRRPRTEHVVLHTTEGTDSSLAAGIATAKWQGTPQNSSNGSYNFILTDEGPILTVPYLEIAGSVSTNRDPSNWRPDRFPWIKDLLSPEAYSDVNAYALAISVSGKTAHLFDYPHIGRIIDDAARLILWAERQPEMRDDLVVTGHFMWQLNRSDPGQRFVNRVMARYAEIKGGTAPLPSPGDDTVLIQQIVEVFPAGTEGEFVPQASGSAYVMRKANADGTITTRKWSPTGTRTPSLLARVSINGGEPALLVGSGDFKGFVVAASGSQPKIIPAPVPDITAAVNTALAPYKTRLAEFSSLASKPLGTA